ncbi:MAG: YlbF family regulator [Clostridiales bacterium]|nr:YlbF family regulator [Clostridiales bacterium]
MGITETLRQLGTEIQADERYVALMAAAAKNDADSGLQDQIGKLNLIMMNYNQEAEKGDDADQKKIGEYNNQYGALYAEIMANENMQQYQQAQTKVEELAKYISQMIGLFLNGEDPATCEVPEDSHNCGDGCSTCAGCN